MAANCLLCDRTLDDRELIGVCGCTSFAAHDSCLQTLLALQRSGAGPLAACRECGVEYGRAFDVVARAPSLPMALGQASIIWIEPVVAHSVAVAPTRTYVRAGRVVAFALVAGSSIVALLALGAFVAVTLTAPWEYSRRAALISVTVTFGVIAGLVLPAYKLARTIRRSIASSAADSTVSRTRESGAHCSPMGAPHHALPPRAAV
jgi:hypothetical protein